MSSKMARALMFGVVYLQDSVQDMYQAYFGETGRGLSTRLKKHRKRTCVTTAFPTLWSFTPSARTTCWTGRGPQCCTRI